MAILCPHCRIAVLPDIVLPGLKRHECNKMRAWKNGRELGKPFKPSNYDIKNRRPH
jgi:hypothetical protein